MFKSNKRLSAADTLIGQGTIGEGKIVCEASLRIEGEYCGDIECKGDVIIGECGVARSNIAARDVTVAGQVFGDIMTKGRLIITATGHLSGNVMAHSFTIQDGGRLNGNCLMEPAEDAKQRAIAEADASRLAAKDSKPKESKEKARQAG